MDLFDKSEKTIFKENLLHLAFKNGSLEIVKFLVELNFFDINKKDSHGNSLFLLLTQGGLRDFEESQNLSSISLIPIKKLVFTKKMMMKTLFYTFWRKKKKTLILLNVCTKKKNHLFGEK